MTSANDGGKSMTNKTTGRCLCGAVKYEVEILKKKNNETETYFKKRLRDKQRAVTSKNRISKRNINKIKAQIYKLKNSSEFIIQSNKLEKEREEKLKNENENKNDEEINKNTRIKKSNTELKWDEIKREITLKLKQQWFDERSIRFNKFFNNNLKKWMNKMFITNISILKNNSDHKYVILNDKTKCEQFNKKTNKNYKKLEEYLIDQLEYCIIVYQNKIDVYKKIVANMCNNIEEYRKQVYYQSKNLL
mgnify:CR=1 FL=1